MSDKLTKIINSKNPPAHTKLPLHTVREIAEEFAASEVAENTATAGSANKRQNRAPPAIGERSGRLSICADLGFRYGKHGGKTRRRYVKCLCDCGKYSEVVLSDLRRGHTKSCGCLIPDLIKVKFTTHGQRKHLLYSVHRLMIRRCYVDSYDYYMCYGGRGISVCKEWRDDFSVFYEWAIGAGWAKGLQIDRINNDGNYEPSNCRFVTPKTNAQNTSRSKVWVIDGVEHGSLSSASESLGVSPTTIKTWYDGKTSSRGIYYPPRSNCYSRKHVTGGGNVESKDD